MENGDGPNKLLPVCVRKYITIRVIGGVGNQLHCYAFGRALAARSGVILKLDPDSGYWNETFNRVYLLDQFPSLNANYTSSQPKTEWMRQLIRLGFKIKTICSRVLPLSLKLVIMEEAPLRYKDELHNSRFLSNPYFIGYWASYRYYREIENELRQELKPPTPTNPLVLLLESQVRSVKSCFIHWRSYKEDKSPEYPDLAGYYSEAVKFISEKHPDVVFFVFSDDPASAKEQVVATDKRMIYVDMPDAQGNLQSLADFYLMYKCDHAIIGNSTFSWWAAWLSDCEGKTVVAPGGVSPWGVDWIPLNWVTIAV